MSKINIDLAIEKGRESAHTGVRETEAYHAPYLIQEIVNDIVSGITLGVIDDIASTRHEFTDDEQKIYDIAASDETNRIATGGAK